MKISEMIAELEKLRQEHGDLTVVSSAYFRNHGWQEAKVWIDNKEQDPRYSQYMFHGLSQPGEKVAFIR